MRFSQPQLNLFEQNIIILNYTNNTTGNCHHLTAIITLSRVTLITKKCYPNTKQYYFTHQWGLIQR